MCPVCHPGSICNDITHMSLLLSLKSVLFKAVGAGTANTDMALSVI